MLFLLTYLGDVRWNHTTEAVVRAKSEAEALAQVADGPWAIERLREEGPTDTILSNWVGDSG